MNSYPLIGANKTQQMFRQEERMNEPKNEPKPSNSFSEAYSSMASLSDMNSNPNTYSNMSQQMPSFLSQARMSTYYQNNPWGVLMDNKKYGVEPLGGDVNPNLPPGYRPGNILRKTD